MPERSNVLGRIDVAVVVERTALHASPSPYSKTRSTFRTATGY